MQPFSQQNQSFGGAASAVGTQERGAFIAKTYVHLLGAVLAFVVLETFYFVTPIAYTVASALFGAGRLGWLVMMLGFMGISWLADRMATSDSSRPVQYAGLGLYTFAQSVLFIPLIALALRFAPDVLPKAALTTTLMFVALSGFVLVTRRDFSFMRGILAVAGLGAIALIVLSMIFGFQLGTVFMVAMIAFACGYILYDTSNVLHRYRTDQYVAASLALFASVTLLLWYVIRFMIARRR